MATPIIITPPPPPPPPDKPMAAPSFSLLLRDTYDILGAAFDTPKARAMLWAIGRQEGRMIHRRQLGGPARGLWQFERGGGVKGVLTHAATKKHAAALCEARGVTATTATVYPTLETDDVLACGFARLLLWSDPAPLPALTRGAEQAAWSYYKRNWRPGKPHRPTWAKFWREAIT